TAVPSALLAMLPNLEFLVTTGPPAHNLVIDVAAAQDRGVAVLGTRGVLEGAMEHTWALLLACAKRITIADRTVKAGGWQTTISTALKGSRLGLLGLGRQGTLMARVGLAFAMDVAAWSQNLTPERCAEFGVGHVSKDELFETSDFVSVHLLLSDRTTKLVGAPELRSMKPTAFLINTSRGPIVDEVALVAALQEQWIAGAGLDVFEEEPLPADHPLRSLENAVLTPHTGYVTDDCYRLFFTEIVENITAYLKGDLASVTR
ncbi:MAG TPA: D-2-hydroxyacid dehydrogenase family protein, partial [Candidatus Acidoferrum sp.]|nr:D-2-hydroxyacid dehydrogenase family protein [Candidatus Acidoferrum sp.]